MSWNGVIQRMCPHVGITMRYLMSRNKMAQSLYENNIQLDLLCSGMYQYPQNMGHAYIWILNLENVLTSYWKSFPCAFLYRAWHKCSDFKLFLCFVPIGKNSLRTWCNLIHHTVCFISPTFSWLSDDEVKSSEPQKDAPRSGILYCRNSFLADVDGIEDSRSWWEACAVLLRLDNIHCGKWTME